MVTSESSTTAMQWSNQPVAYFMAGVLVPTIAYFLLNRQGGKNRSAKIIDVGDGDDWDDIDDDNTAPLHTGSNPSASWSLMDAPYKMVLCVNTSLGMGKGE